MTDEKKVILPDYAKGWLDKLIEDRDKAPNKDVVAVAFQLLNAKMTQEALYGAIHEFFDKFHLGGMIKKDTFKLDMSGKAYTRPDKDSVDWYLHAGKGHAGELIAKYLIEKIEK